MPQIQLFDAVETFIYAFCAFKSEFGEYSPKEFESPSKERAIWALEDLSKRKSPRKTEVVTYGIRPAEIVKIIEENKVGWHFLCHIAQDDEVLELSRSEFKNLGYRQISTEWVFTHDLQNIPEFISNPPPKRIESEAQLALIPQHSKQKQKLSLHSTKYCVFDQTTDFGWCMCYRHKDFAYTHGLYVFDFARKRGYGAALMCKLLHDNRSDGVSHNVLLASKEGAKLYPRLGFQKLATMHIFCPVKR